MMVRQDGRDIEGFIEPADPPDGVPMRGWRERLRGLYLAARRPVLFTLIGAAVASVGLYAGSVSTLPEERFISFEDEPHHVTVPRPDAGPKGRVQKDIEGKTVYRYTEESSILKAQDGRYIFRKRETHDIFMKPGEEDMVPEMLERFRRFHGPDNDSEYIPEDRAAPRSIDREAEVSIDDKVMPI